MSFQKLILASSPLYVVADLPVHCLRPQLIGKWNFHLGPATEQRTTCGHKTPDIDKDQPSLESFKTEKTISVKLMDPNDALVDNESGQWTMIYDEGLSIKSDAIDLFSFSHFQMPKDPMVHGKKYFESFCGKTEVGWYREKETGKYGCFKAERKETGDANAAFYHLSLLEQEKQGLGKKQFLKSEQAFNRDQYVTSLDHERIVSDINSRQSSWKAERYSDEFIREKMGQLQLRAMRKVGRSGLTTVVSMGATEPTADADETEETSDLPKDWHWDNVNGTSWIEPVLDQQDCGSCYAVSSVHMLTSRFRIFKNDPKAEGFSVNFPLYCSDLNQGCSGGYPSLVSMWSGDVGLVPKQCTGRYYTSSTATCKDTLQKHVAQADFEKCVEKSEEEGKLGSVASWNYIGGYYGGCTSGKMMQDLFKFGPVAVALEPGMDFMYYNKGIYSSAPVKTNVPWVKVDHAVLLIGWGEEDGKPFWTIQNSWGSGWGENGTIRMIRGENESGVEFQAVSAQLADGAASKILSYVSSIVGDSSDDPKVDSQEEKESSGGNKIIV
jgi:cathepsin C